MSLKDALQSELCEKISQIPELSREKGGGCIMERTGTGTIRTGAHFLMIWFELTDWWDLNRQF
jgi:hypothetical protein